MPSFRTYPVAVYGLGSQFPETERPPAYATQLRNRFINSGGGAEKRRGIVQLGGDVTGHPNLTSLHEFIDSKGTARLMAGGNGKIFALDTSAQTTWTQVYTGLDTSAVQRSVQMGDKLIVANGSDRNIFTKNGTTFIELKGLIETFQRTDAQGGGANNYIVSGDKAGFTNWLTQSDVAINDLLWQSQTSAGRLITNVAASVLTMQPTSGGAPTEAHGLASGWNTTTAGLYYDIIDLVELNIVPTEQGDTDNVAVAGSGTNVSAIRVSGLNNFATTEIKTGDYIRNTTREGTSRVKSIASGKLVTTEVSAQTVGDSLVFLKQAMPITQQAHVHYGRAYYLDARNRRTLVVSGPNDPRDVTTDAGTLDSSQLSIADQQPVGDEIMGMASFQQYFVLAGRRFVTFFTGTDPIADTSADSTDFKAVALFEPGLAAQQEIKTIGNDVIFLTRAGMQAASLTGSEILPTRENLSESIRDEFQQAVSGAADSAMKLIHYPKRQWVMAKVSNQMFVFNYSPYIAELDQRDAEISRSGRRGSWSIFDGPIAQQNDYMVRQNGTLVMAGASGKVYRFDDPGQWTDAGTVYDTLYETAWLGMDERGLTGTPSRSQKKGVAIMPTVEGSANITYTIGASSSYTSQSGESVTHIVSASENPVNATKIPLRWRGERVKFSFATSGGVGPDVLTNFTVVYNKAGVL